MAHWIQDAKLQERIRSEVCNPVMTTMLDFRPFGLNPEFATGNLKPGDKLMQPVGTPEHKQTMTIQADDETTAYEWRYYVQGFWAVSFCMSLYIPIEMRGLVPVWRINVFGRFAESVVGDLDRAEEIEELLGRSGKHANGKLRKRSEFYPRGIPGIQRAGMTYGAEWTGDVAAFSGSERVTKDGTEDVLWSAVFHGGIPMPIS